MAHHAPAPGKYAEDAFRRLLTVLNTLRTECPWDRKQTMQSLRLLTIEEMYELADAILENDLPEVKKELGDLLMHIVFYAKIAEEQDIFSIVDVLNSVCDKLIHRHPHIYGDVSAKNEEEVKKNWEKIKLNEGSRSVLAGVPKSLPAVVKAYRIQDKARGVGFDWSNRDQVWAKVEEEMEEFKATWPDNDTKKSEEMESEFGDLLFSLINYARFVGIDPETALEKTNRKFIRRFSFIESSASESGRSIHELNLEEMDRLWNQAKVKE